MLKNIFILHNQFQDSWTYPPFDAHIDENGKIYARGAQDMKSIAIQFIEAVREMKESGVVLQRTVHLSFVPGIFHMI